jgi:hypothetical protein
MASGDGIFEPDEHPGKPEYPLTSQNPVDLFNLNSFASLCQNAIATKIRRSPAFNHSLGLSLAVRHLKWVPHHFTVAVMEQRLQLPKRLPVTVMSANHRGWTHLLTADKSWSWMTIDDKQQWFSAGAQTPARPQKQSTL